MQLALLNDEVMYLRNMNLLLKTTGQCQRHISLVMRYSLPHHLPATGMFAKTAGTSGSDEPSWSTDISEVVTDGTVEWEVHRFRQQAKGLIRGQFGTTAAIHAADSQLYIIEQTSLSSITHPIIQSGQQLYVKSQPSANGELIDLSTVAAVNKPIS